jgi:NADH:ubiquinone reductase (non-electrogenic)
MFSKQLIDYTVSTFSASKIEILTKTMVQEVKEKSVVLKMPDGTVKDVPCGMVIWAAGNTMRQVTRDLMSRLPEHQTNKRGILVDGAVVDRMCGTS